jgi:hypothetical protein
MVYRYECKCGHQIWQQNSRLAKKDMIKHVATDPRHLADIMRWKIFKDRKLDYMQWWAVPYTVTGEALDPRRFHSWNAAIEHVLKAMR